MKKIFVIHGWTYTIDKWREFNDLLRKAGVEVVMFRVPGLTEESDRVWDLNDYLEWLKEKLANEQEAVIMGHSNGGRIAMAFAVKYPQLVGKLILEDSAGIYHNELPLRIKRQVFGAVARLGKKFTGSDFLKKFLYKLAGENDYKRANPNMRKTMANLISVDLSPQLSEINTPTLIIWGAQDKATPLSDGQMMHRIIAGSKLYVIKSAKHSPHFTNAGEVAAKVLQFLQ